MEEKFEFAFANGASVKVVLGEDGYNANVIQVDDKPLMGTFTDFENLLYGIAPIVQNNASSNQEFVQFAQELSLSLSNTLVIDEIEDILLK
jgi:hypothetical protein